MTREALAVPGPRALAEALLVIVALGWAFGFVLMKMAVEGNSVWTVLWIRFALAALFMLPFCLGRQRWGKGALGAGALLGVLLFASFGFLISGLQRTTAANTGLLTGLCVVWVPLLSRILLGKTLQPGTLVGVALCVMGVLVMSDSQVAPLGVGDLLVVIGSLFAALHILAVDRWSAAHDPAALTLVQVVVVALLSCAASIPSAAVLPARLDVELMLTLLGAAFVSTALAFWIQTRYQRETTPTRAAMIFNLEPVFSALLAYGVLGEPVGLHVAAACALIVAGMCATEMRFPQRRASRP